MTGAAELAVWVAAIAAGVAAVIYLARLAYRGVIALARGARMVVTMHDVVTRELEHNHGSSIKDDVHGMAVALGKTQREVGRIDGHLRELDARLTTHMEGDTP